jgi:hypothetical protein
MHIKTDEQILLLLFLLMVRVAQTSDVGPIWINKIMAILHTRIIIYNNKGILLEPISKLLEQDAN